MPLKILQFPCLFCYLCCRLPLKHQSHVLDGLFQMWHKEQPKFKNQDATQNCIYSLKKDAYFSACAGNGIVLPFMQPLGNYPACRMSPPRSFTRVRSSTYTDTGMGKHQIISGGPYTPNENTNLIWNIKTCWLSKTRSSFQLPLLEGILAINF